MYQAKISSSKVEQDTEEESGNKQKKRKTSYMTTNISNKNKMNDSSSSSNGTSNISDIIKKSVRFIGVTFCRGYLNSHESGEIMEDEGTVVDSTSANININTTTCTPVFKVTNTMREMSTMEDKDFIGLDTCSAVSATTEQSDMLVYDSDEKYKHTHSMEGVGGGVATPRGVGIGLFPLYNTPDGSIVILFDTNTVLMNKNSTDDQSIRIVSSPALRKHGMGIKQFHKETNGMLHDVLMHQQSGKYVYINEQSGIMALDTLNKSASNYKNNKIVLAAIDAHINGNGPPFAILPPPYNSPHTHVKCTHEYVRNSGSTNMDFVVVPSVKARVLQ
jgi:hypothetical protein